MQYILAMDTLAHRCPFLYFRCPPKWDGWQCWERGGRPGHTEYVECPEYIYFKTSALENGGNCKGNILSEGYHI